ncbi:MAG: hypothetical protein HUU46_16675 [Candidatus Hydrogenedentes bacterium]|nr:hypothetical protein [Candidatus Hydrogenedentota bacterium]
MTVQCCKCKRFRVDGQWSAPAASLHQGDVSHTYCPVCADETFIELFSAQASRSTAHEALCLREFLGQLAMTA